MAYELRDLSGALFKNRDKKPDDSRPEYKGDIRVGDQVYWLSAWLKQGSDGNTFMSLALTPKDVQKAAGEESQVPPDAAPF